MSPKRTARRAAAVFAGLFVLLLALRAGALIYLSFFPADQGTFAPLGQSAVSFTSDANHAATQAEYAGLALNVTSTTSLGATRLMFLPCIAGEAKLVTNSTTGSQSIAVACLGSDGGAAGTSVTIANGQASSTVVLSPDGVNYVSAGGGAGGAIDAASLYGVPMGGDLSNTNGDAAVGTASGLPIQTGWDSGLGVFGIFSSEACIGYGSDAGGVCATEFHCTTTTGDAGSPKTCGQLYVSPNRAVACGGQFFAADYGVDGGLAGNFVKCSVDFVTTSTPSGLVEVSAAGVGPSSNSVVVPCLPVLGEADAGGVYDSGAQVTTDSFLVQLATTAGASPVTYQLVGPNSDQWHTVTAISCKGLK